METSLHVAVNKMHFGKVLKSLACPGADVNAKNSKGQTALFIALISGFSDAARVILEHPDVDVPDARELTSFHYVVSCGLGMFDEMVSKADVNLQTRNGFSSLHLAVKHNRIAFIERLLQCDNVDVNATNKYGRTPLMLACTHVGGSIGRKVYSVKLLLADHRTDVWLRENGDGRTAMEIVESIGGVNSVSMRAALLWRMRCDMLLTLVTLSSVKRGNALSRFPIELLRYLMMFL